MIRRLKKLGANKEELMDVYFKQVRSILEVAVPVWQPGLTQQELKQIERVQKCALHIILGRGTPMTTLHLEHSIVETYTQEE